MYASMYICMYLCMLVCVLWSYKGKENKENTQKSWVLLTKIRNGPLTKKLGQVFVLKHAAENFKHSTQL